MSNEDRQRETDRQAGAHERRTMDCARFSTPDASAIATRVCKDCQRIVPATDMIVYPFGLLCQLCGDEEQTAPKLRVNDRVLWASSFGSGSPVEATVKTITLTDGVWPDEGEEVQRVNWVDCRDRKVAVTLDNGKWAWGFQLAPWMAPAELARRLRDRAATEAEEVFTEGRVHRQPFRTNPHD